MEDKWLNMENILENTQEKIEEMREEVQAKKEKMQDFQSEVLCRMQQDLSEIAAFRNRHKLYSPIRSGVKMPNTNKEVFVLPCCEKYMFGIYTGEMMANGEEKYMVLGNFSNEETNGVNILTSFQAYFLGSEEAEECFLTLAWNWDTISENLTKNVFQQAQAEQEKELEKLRKELKILNVREKAYEANDNKVA